MRAFKFSLLVIGLILLGSSQAQATSYVCTGPVDPYETGRFLRRIVSFLFMMAWLSQLVVFATVLVYRAVRLFMPQIKRIWFVLAASALWLSLFYAPYGDGYYCNEFSEAQKTFERTSIWLAVAGFCYAGYFLILKMEPQRGRNFSVLLPIGLLIGIPAWAFLLRLALG